MKRNVKEPVKDNVYEEIIINLESEKPIFLI